MNGHTVAILTPKGEENYNHPPQLLKEREAETKTKKANETLILRIW